MADIMITGGLGYLGSAIARLLRSQHEVRILDTRVSNKVSEIRGVKQGPWDICELPVDSPYPIARQKRSLGEARPVSRSMEVPGWAWDRTDAVIHLAAIPGLDTCAADPFNAVATNVWGTARLAKICRDHEIPLIFASTAGVYGPTTEMPISTERERVPAHFYGQTKRAAEDVLAGHATADAPMLSLQMTNLYGEHDVGEEIVSKPTVLNHFIGQAGGTLTVHEPGTQERDFLHVQDAAAAYVSAVDRMLSSTSASIKASPGAPPRYQRLLLASEENHEIESIARLVADRVPSEIEVQAPPAGDRVVYDRFETDASQTREALGWDTCWTVERYIDARLDAGETDSPAEV